MADIAGTQPKLTGARQGVDGCLAGVAPGQPCPALLHLQCQGLVMVLWASTGICYRGAT